MALKDMRRHPFASGFGFACAMLTAFGAFVAVNGRNVLGALLILLSWVALLVGTLVAARFRKPGDPL